jgi:hypothetical protein
MATTKKRLNITLPKEVEEALSFVAKRDNVPDATKATSLLTLALEIEEDAVLDHIAKKRDTKKTVYVSHKDAWK